MKIIKFNVLWFLIYIIDIIFKRRKRDNCINNISPRQLEKFLKKNHWDISFSKSHNKISFKEEVITNGKVVFKTSKLNIHLKRNPVSEEAIKEVKKAFELINEVEYSKKEFNELIKNHTKIIKIT